MSLTRRLLVTIAGVGIFTYNTYNNAHIIIVSACIEVVYQVPSYCGPYIARETCAINRQLVNMTSYN